jgi:hypothetical protein
MAALVSAHEGALDLIMSKPGGGGTVVQQRWCVVNSQGFQMFAPNRIPTEGEEPEHQYGWREMIDARLDKMPPGHGREKRCCFTISVGLARHEEATLTFVDRNRERAEHWVLCLHAGMDREWGGAMTAPAIRPSSQRGAKPKSTRRMALAAATTLVMGAQAVPSKLRVGKHVKDKSRELFNYGAESVWSAVNGFFDDVYKGIDGPGDREVLFLCVRACVRSCMYRHACVRTRDAHIWRTAR